MPTYEYRCPNGHEFEEFFRTISSAATELKCPTCGALAPRQVSGGGGLVFKGSGFYITDYGKDGKKDQRAARKPDSAAESSTSSGDGKGAGADKTGSTPPKAPEAPGKKSE